ncbi:endodeoxyribonuclease RusA [Limnospira maxima CS-328]|uniref:Endodeoxyribonuclease RusA n=1 Tax=Limnospira maxima CS-328 TaxID=513049 RepID=B5VV93_LIMMA|nr:RusA family crossover junction endodeoxyribonuclease [Limnospira maxima]EDZ96965.1 endodeoxyribonuclease RusA [Limnospira maxima CS-328]
MLTELKPKISELENLARAISYEHQRCLGSPQTALVPAYHAGVLLLQAQTKLTSTDWEGWLESIDISAQSADTYMQIARTWPGFLGVEIGIEAACIGEYAPQPKPLESEAQKEVEPPIEEVEPPIEEVEDYDTPIDVEFTPVPPEEEIPPKTELISFVIEGAVVPKARPRVTSNGTYLPPRYREWRNRAEVELYRQISERNLTNKFPLRRAAVTIRLFGNHRTNSDIDNLAGACLDALTLQGAGVLMDDRLSCLPKLRVEFFPDIPKTGVWIDIEPLSY